MTDGTHTGLGDNISRHHRKPKRSVLASGKRWRSYLASVMSESYVKKASCTSPQKTNKQTNQTKALTFFLLILGCWTCTYSCVAKVAVKFVQLACIFITCVVAFRIRHHEQCWAVCSHQKNIIAEKVGPVPGQITGGSQGQHGDRQQFTLMI